MTGPQLLPWECLAAGEQAGGRLFCGDNLDCMALVPGGSVDLVYADPPFFSGKDYARENCVFQDTWDHGLDGYLAWLRPRLRELKRILRPGGSLYIHLDWHAVHYVKLELDRLFGYENFRNEIIWTYHAGGRSRRFWARKHDNILFYTNGEDWTFNADAVLVPYASNMAHWSYTRGRMRGKVQPAGKVPEDVFTGLELNTMASERTGYPTQKPESLLERLILASSNPGDTVADFFAGSGTALVVARRLGRNWVGGDLSPAAVALTARRLQREPGNGFSIQRVGSYHLSEGDSVPGQLGSVLQLPPGWILETGPEPGGGVPGVTWCAPDFTTAHRQWGVRAALSGTAVQLVRFAVQEGDELSTLCGRGRVLWVWAGPGMEIEYSAEGGVLRLACRVTRDAQACWWITGRDGAWSHQAAGAQVEVTLPGPGDYRAACLAVDAQGAGAARGLKFTI
ncbi:MAG: site-specific DNA-methyltransferase [Bacillota bacterium]